MAEFMMSCALNCYVMYKALLYLSLSLSLTVFVSLFVCLFLWLYAYLEYLSLSLLLSKTSRIIIIIIASEQYCPNNSSPSFVCNCSSLRLNSIMRCWMDFSPIIILRQILQRYDSVQRLTSSTIKTRDRYKPYYSIRQPYKIYPSSYVVYCLLQN